MNDIIDKKSNRMGIDTYSGIINVKYSLQATSSLLCIEDRIPFMTLLTKTFVTTSAPLMQDLKNDLP